MDNVNGNGHIENNNGYKDEDNQFTGNDDKGQYENLNNINDMMNNININGNNNNQRTVCIIGAGSAGLVCARHLYGDDEFKVTIYEQSNQVGGTWCYTDDVGIDPLTGSRIHSSMYQNLRTNLPLNIMEYPDYPVKSSKCNFESHREVLEYLKSYCKHFKLYNVIKFHHKIIHVTRLTRSKVWLVKVKNLQTGDIETKYFDSIIISSGRYSVPRLPNIVGMNVWQKEKQIIHTHDYRLPSPYKNQTVLILGAGPSGIDICIEVSSVAKKVYLCHNLPESYKDLDDIVIQVNATIQSIDSNCTINLSNGSKLSDVDTIILATGYLYDLSFLDIESCGISIECDDSHVLGLYQHLICIQEPTLCIFAIPYLTLPFPIYHQQALFFISSLKGKLKLPSVDEMKLQEKLDIEYRKCILNWPEKYSHKMSADLLWQYDDFLSSTASIKPISKSKRDIFKSLRMYRATRTKNYRSLKFVIDSDEHFTVIDPNDTNVDTTIV